MKVFTLSLLALSIALSLSACVPPVSAAECLNRYRPMKVVQITPHPDGSKTVRVGVQDYDYKARSSIYVFENGRPLYSNLQGGFFERKMPKGTGLWGIFTDNLDACGKPVETIDVEQVQN